MKKRIKIREHKNQEGDTVYELLWPTFSGIYLSLDEMLTLRNDINSILTYVDLKK